MTRVGITGGVGMGKSTCGALLARQGIPVVDTDELAREVVAPGTPALEAIRAAFGPEFLTPEGALDRGRMARRVFADAEARRQLEAILHPPIRERWRAQFAAWRQAGRPLAVVVIPLLFETGAEAELDDTLCVACSADTQRHRLLARGWSPAQIQQRIEAQWPIEKKIAAADFLVWTEGGPELLAPQLDRILASIQRREPALDWSQDRPLLSSACPKAVTEPRQRSQEERPERRGHSE